MTKKYSPALAPMCTFEMIIELEEAGTARKEIVEQLETRLKSNISFEGE